MKFLDTENLNKYSVSYLLVYICDLVDYELFLLDLINKKNNSEDEDLMLKVRLWHTRSIKEHVHRHLESRGY